MDILGTIINWIIIIGTALIWGIILAGLLGIFILAVLKLKKRLNKNN